MTKTANWWCDPTLNHNENTRFESIELGPGLTYRFLVDDRWKTLSIDVFCKIPMARETVTCVALAPRLAKRGTAELPGLRDISRRLESMFGAGVGADATKIGPVQVARFGIDLPSPAFIDPDLLGDDDGLNLAKAMSFIWNLTTKPYLENGAYPKDRFDMEKEEHKRDILGIINNRTRYATVRLMEVISGGSPDGLPAWGKIEDLDRLTPEGTWLAWAKRLSEAPISIYAVGQGVRELGEILSRVNLEFPHDRAFRNDAVASPAPSAVSGAPGKVIEAEDFLPGEQTVLCVAFATGIREGHPDFPALILYDGILGGFPHSKLFRNVREKEQICYFADSSLNAWRGMVVAVAGVSDPDTQKAKDLIIAQAEAMRAGDISDEEMDNTRAGLLRRYRSESDSQGALIRRLLSTEIVGGPTSEEELVSRIMRVTKEDVARVADLVQLNAVYALRAKRGAGRG